jgi:hypothetical protein
MNRKEEQRLIAELEADASDPDAWEDDPAPASTKRVLGAQVTIRLDPELAERARRIADAHRVGYTSLLRRWIEERVQVEEFGTVQTFPVFRAWAAGFSDLSHIQGSLSIQGSTSFLLTGADLREPA